MTNWIFFKIEGHIFSTSISIIFAKNEKHRQIAKLINAPLTGISELKLNDSLLTSKIQINEHDLLCCDRNKYWGGVACYIRNELSSKDKSDFSKVMETFFFNHYYQQLN